jgi:hypothetical protein
VRPSTEATQRASASRHRQADQRTGAQLADDQPAQSDLAERQAAHGCRLALRADRIGQIDQARHDEGQCRLGGQRRFESGHDHVASMLPSRPTASHGRRWRTRPSGMVLASAVDGRAPDQAGSRSTDRPAERLVPA